MNPNTTKDPSDPNTPTDHKAVNAWMLANGWEWLEDKRIGVQYWYKESFGVVYQGLAAEMYRMSEVRVAEAHLKGIRHQKTFCIGFHRNRKEIDMIVAQEVANALKDYQQATDATNYIVMRDELAKRIKKQLAATNPRKEA